MPRYVGVKNGSIRIISNAFFVNSDVEILELPDDLNEVSPQELMLNYSIKNGQIVSHKNRKLAKDLKVAFITNHAMECGISTYGKFLFSEISKHISEFKLFVEKNENPVDPINQLNGIELSDDQIVQCWERGKSLQELIDKIKDYNPDIILLNHEFGIYPNARYWISMMNQLSKYRMIVIMHSIFEHKDKTIVEGSIPEIIVHLESAKTVLKDKKKISAKVNVIKHGTFPCTDQSKLWNFYKSDHTFIQQGFLFRYKGFQNSIKAVGLLKDKYPDVFFTGLCSEGAYGKLEHENYYNELLELIKEHNIEENVGLIRGYQSDEVLNSYLRTNKVAVFPYISDPNHICHGVSGAAPYAMSKGIPVISSSIPHFSELPSIKADSPEEIATELDKLFSNSNLIKEQILKQNQYLEDNSWANTALKFIKIFEN